MKTLLKKLFLCTFLSLINLCGHSVPTLDFSLDFQVPLSEETIQEVAKKVVATEGVEMRNQMVTCCLRVKDDKSGKILYININQTNVEMFLKTDSYSEDFRRTVAFVFNYLVKKMCHVTLSFCEEPEEGEKPYGHIIFEPYETLELEWPDTSLAPELKDFLICIAKNNPLMKTFTYDNCEDSETETLRFVLNGLKGCPRLRVLHLENHYEEESEFLIDLLKTVQIKELYIPEWFLSDEEMNKLLTFLQDYPGLEKLCISQNCIKKGSFYLLGKLASNPGIKELYLENLNNMEVGKEDLKTFISGIERENPSVLKISFEETLIPEKNWHELQGKLHELLPNCEISINLISDEYADSLAAQAEELTKENEDSIEGSFENTEVPEIAIGEPLEKKQKRSEDAWGNTETNSSF